MKNRIWVLVCGTALLWLSANSYLLGFLNPGWWAAQILCGLAAVLLPLTASRQNGIRLWLLAYGNECLKIFLFAVVISLPAQVLLLIFFRAVWVQWLISLLICICALAVYFWIGILCVYCTSVQLGIKRRVLGAICGLIPVVQVLALILILKVTHRELCFEAEKKALDRSRHDQAICKTRYPILLVHGVFFRDTRFFNYWGRIPGSLKENGADIHYGNHPSAASVSDCGKFLAERIQEVCRQTGAEKVNIIAHSKGGLDCRYAMAFCGAAPYVASLTTVNTPHRGCNFADFLLEKIPDAAQQKVANTYNRALSSFGEKTTDFMAAVYDLTSSRCTQRDKEMPLPQGVYCQSVGSVLVRAAGGKFPLNFSYHLVRCFDGANDGLVGEESFSWGENFTLLRSNGSEGISHGDIIDLNRYNLPGFDVREFYVQLVSDLRQRGL